MAASLLVSVRASVLLLSALAAAAALACGGAVDSDSGLTPSPTGAAGAGGSGASGGIGGSGGSGGSNPLGGGGTGGGFSAACEDGSVPLVSASYLDAGPDAGDSGAGERDAGTPPTDGGALDGDALDGGSAPGDAGDLAVPRRIRVAVQGSALFWVEEILELGPGVVLLRDPFWFEGARTIELLVSTSRPWIDLRLMCGEYPSVPLTIELVLGDSSIDARASYAHLSRGN